MNSEKPEVVESIVVEGRGDYAAVLSAVSADIIITHGFKIRNSARARILSAAKGRGVIVFTDPDHAGEEIRRKVSGIVGAVTSAAAAPAIKHARIVREDGLRGGDVGVENASSNCILDALIKAGATFRGHVCGAAKSQCADISQTRSGARIAESDMHRLGLVGDGSRAVRIKLGRILGIGYANSKQFLHRLNAAGVTVDRLEKLVSED